MCDLNIVSVDSRGRSTSDIEAYSNHTCSLSYFKRKVASHPHAICHKSKVAALCGLDLKVYFHRDDVVTNHLNQRKEQINHAATLLTLDPASGFAKYHIRGVAYVVMNDGIAPLSMQQVWGMVELANSALDYFKFDPDHQIRGQKELLKNCAMYRAQSWGPLCIYNYREDESSSSLRSDSHPAPVIVRPQSHRHSKSRKPFATIQV
jgi:hypothetical protein